MAKKKCGVCQYWAATLKPEQTLEQAKLENDKVIGNCFRGGRHRPMFENEDCLYNDDLLQTSKPRELKD